MIVLWGSVVRADVKPVPQLQAIPQPYEQISFVRDGVEIARYHFGPTLRRPFVFPVIGPAGLSLTRMGHPHDPESHSHHNSVWISHNSVNGVSFWDDRAKGKIVHQRVEALDEENGSAFVLSTNAWVDEASKKTLLTERRRTSIQLLESGEYFLMIDLEFSCKEQVTLGKTPFGLIGARMAKTIGTNDGGGTIRNSEGKTNEGEVFWKPAKWVDYSGAITNKAIEGITLMDHPGNPNHPSVFHVRGDGWMGASLTFDGPRIIEAQKPLRLRYGLYVHGGAPGVEELEKRWKQFAELKLPEMEVKKK
ncbi:MAG TPA: PmoA family protein [Tepidisphaeraceae bacterium]|nr:PmoA family protein [Tepidisphaeraceae bacterium]